MRGGNETPQEDYESTYSLPGTLGGRGVSSVYILTFGFKWTFGPLSANVGKTLPRTGQIRTTVVAVNEHEP